MGAAAAVSGASLIGGVMEGESVKLQGEYSKKIADVNARTVELKADDTLMRGDSSALNFKRQVRKLRGAQRAAAGASGVDVNTGTNLELQQQTEELGAIDALTIKNNAWKEAWGLRSQATNIRFQGELANLTAKGQAARTYAAAGLDAFKYGASRLGRGGGDDEVSGRENATSAGRSYRSGYGSDGSW